jgi:chitin disaccharide deacetylase
VKALIVNADDFGHSEPVNAGVIEAFERGIVTSASLMTRRAAAGAAAAYARTQPRLGLGLHVDLGDWRYTAREGWVGSRTVDDAAIEQEVGRQLDAFRTLAGDDPTHLDSHHHAHRREPARSVLLALAAALDVPLRHFDARVRYCGDFYGQTGNGSPLPERITPEALIGVIASLPVGVTELGCHPGRAGVRGSQYAAERERELAALCDPRVRDALTRHRVRLLSFADAAGLR